jgi:penicillin-binding protein 1A
MRPVTIFGIALALAAVAGSALGSLFALDLPEVQALEDYRPPVMSTVLAADGSLLENFARQRRVVIERRRIPEAFVQALVATEDSRFYSHTGVDALGILRAAWSDLRNRRLGQGASTLTMQLARTLFLHRDKTLERKIREAFLAMEIERNYSKDEIFALYANMAYMGHGRYGLEAASRFYLGKPALEMDLAESALMAGLIQRPEGHSPFRDPEQAMRRRAHVLRRMVHEGYISEAHAAEAARAPLRLAKREKLGQAAPHFVEEVRRLVKERYGDAALYGEGLQIVTTLDPGLQRIARQALALGLEDLRARHGAEADAVEAALIAIDTASGEILAMVGGSDFGSSEWNRATQAKRQAGSAFKPFVYAAALSQGWTLADRILDEPTIFLRQGAPAPYRPENYSHTYHGNITLRRALEESANIATVKLLQLTGYDATIDLTRRLGIKSPLRPYPSLALGAFEVSLIELTSAYATFANRGMHVEPHFIREVRQNDGRLLMQAEPRIDDALDPRIAHLINEALEGVVSDGTGKAAAALGRPLAGKTGTTDRNADAWFIGYSPDIAVGVWVGYDDNRSIGATETGAMAALPIWMRFMERALEGRPVTGFDRPEGMTYVAVDRQTGLRVAHEEGCRSSHIESFVAGTEPTRYCSQAEHMEIASQAAWANERGREANIVQLPR